VQQLTNPLQLEAAGSSSSGSDSSSGVFILPGPGEHLARQLLSVTTRSPAAAAAAAATTAAAAAAPTAPPHAASAAGSAHTDDSTSAAAAAVAEGLVTPSSSEEFQVDLPRVQLQLVGQHQAGNVATAVAAAVLLAKRGWRGVTGEAILRGLESAWLPGRFQVRRVSKDALRAFQAMIQVEQ